MMKMQSLEAAQRRRRWARGAATSALVATLALAGCSGGTYGSGGEAATGGDGAAEGATTEATDWDALIDIDGMDFEYTDRDKDASYDAASATVIALNGSGATVQGAGAMTDGSTVTISAAGTYVVSGELMDGSLVVNATDQDKVQVVLAGVTIRNAAGPALEVRQADKVFVTLADGTQNILADGAQYTLVEGEDEPNAALFSRGDLTINGAGALVVEGNYRHGVNSKDDLVITGGAITVTAVEDGLRGKDCVKIADGAFTVTAGGDGVKSSNDEDPTCGFVSIDGGTFALNVQDDGVQAATYLRITGGSGTVTAADHALRSEVEAAMTGGSFTVEAGGKGMNPETRFTMDGGELTVTGCDEGIEAEKVIVNDGMLNIVASDDGINAAVAERSDETSDAAAATAEGSAGADADAGATRADEAAAGEAAGEAPAKPQGGKGDRSMRDGDDAPDGDAAPDGDFQPPVGEDGQMPEPPEKFDDAQNGERPELSENFDLQNTPQDGERPELPEGMEEGQMPQRPEGDEDFGGVPGRGGRSGAGGPMGANASEECLIQINGGRVTVDAGGDGLDSNGYVEINGGVVLADGSDAGGDSALDYEYGASITGGTVILAGSAGMAETFTEGTQPFALVSASGAAGDTLAIVDNAGNAIAEYAVPKAFQCAVVSSPDFVEGTAYEAVVNGAAVEFTASVTPSANGAKGAAPDRRSGGSRPGDAETEACRAEVTA